MRRPQRGISIVEVLVSIVLIGVVIMSLMPMFPTALLTDSQSRARARATAVAESWIDRYREGKEPLFASGPCVQTTSDPFVVTCTYGYDHDFAADSFTSHADSASQLSALNSGHRTVITARRMLSGSNSSHWNVRVEVFWKLKGEQHVALTTLLNG